MARIKATSIDRRASTCLKLLAVCAVALSAANCAKNPQRYAARGGGGSEIDPKYGVRASPRLYNEGDAIPKGGGRRFAGKPYVIAGRTYVPREDAHGYVREGLASWYGSAFHGRKTANGEIFDRHSIAAAHPTLPLPSYARVTNLSNGYSMVVRVNDRGPYHANRVMDVSEEVARNLNFHRKGTERVRVEYVGRASLAGSDDRKLMASLRTDGNPAGIHPGAPVMVADLGQDGLAADRFERPARPPLAFKPNRDEEDGAPGPSRPAPRPAPIVVASAPVPAAVQPNAVRPAAFRPAPRPSESVTVAALHAPPANRAAAMSGRTAPLSLAPPPIRLVEAARERPPAKSIAPSAPAKPGQTRLAAPAIPAASKDAMARLASAAAPKAPAGKPAPRRSLLAEVN